MGSQELFFDAADRQHGLTAWFALSLFWFVA